MFFIDTTDMNLSHYKGCHLSAGLITQSDKLCEPLLSILLTVILKAFWVKCMSLAVKKQIL